MLWPLYPLIHCTGVSTNPLSQWSAANPGLVKGTFLQPKATLGSLGQIPGALGFHSV